ncbi:MAG TPA: iron-sulfur cluster assembly scaffold protein [Verrucomicrobiae bacterium]|jgi:nitrogen fixation NifU-like protein|nr:iron-sulfur cluster assembly scaffold protein [Verrucomicrobiae bacterium]
MRYSETLIEHFRHPRNAGMMRDPDGVGESEYAECMDLARVFLRVREGRIEDARFQTYGCGPTIAASSAATELIRGAALADVLELADAQVTAAVGGLPPDRAHAAQVVTAAIRAAARDAVARYETTSPEGE